MPKKGPVRRHPVTQPADTSYKIIPLTRNQNALVDATDYDWLNQWNWRAKWSKEIKGFYAARGAETIYMQYQILGCKKGEQGDHRNHDTLDNRRENLRKSSPWQNRGNSRLNANSTTGFKGVSWSKSGNGFLVQLNVNRKHYRIGLFPTAKDAAMAYDKAAKKLLGEFAHLNFPKS